MLAENSSYHLSQSLLDKKSDAFPLERFRFLPDAAKFKNITTYLGEYRFNQAIDDYCLIFEGGLRGKHETELLATQIKRSIARKKELWKKTHREEADLSGVLSMEKQLTTSQEGDFIVWASPPEPESNEYGNHGFIYVGRVSAEEDTGNKEIKIFDFRIESKNLADYNQALTRLTGREVNYRKGEDFIASPMLVDWLADGDIIHVLEETCRFQRDEDEATVIAETIRLITPHIHGFIGFANNEESTVAVREAFFALEKYAVSEWNRVKQSLKLKIQLIRQTPLHDTFEEVLDRYDGRRLPAAVGSCGATEVGGGIFTKYLSVADITNSSENKFVCPACNKKSDPPVGNSCPKCGITKEEAVKRGLTTC